MAIANQGTLQSLLREIESMLIDSIPQTVHRLKASERVYALVLVYYDLTTNERTPYFILPRESLRLEILQREGLTDGSWKIWSPLDLNLREQTPCEGSSLREKCRACYDFIDFDGKDELDALLPFREMLYRVALALNRHDWRDILNCTDDFVVLVSDWTSYRLQEDALASIPLEKRKLLEDRHLLFYEESNDPWVVAYKRSEMFKKGIRESVEEEKRFWFSQLEEVASGNPLYARHGDTLALVALDCLKQLGADVVVPLLSFGNKYIEEPSRRGLDPDGHEITNLGIVNLLVEVVAEIGHVNAAVESLLLEMLVNAHRKYPRTPTTLYCASALHGLSSRFPEPRYNEHDELDNLKAFLDAAPPLRDMKDAGK